ncbi:unnamed protein product [Phytophthora fragariaefolia]|uniref:Unnamed protein product n=1 Tax=Phytophthora fragariaefolia TaxID=1490495 RepID=A0A9W6TS25_9STRA|nr:unnamed protein product [Phytophthora fragariaefolia]
MRQHSLKRKRVDAVDASVPTVRRVQLWGQRLFASIYTNERNETFIKELLKTEDGGAGEMEATGQVQVGDMILAVNHTRALGLSSKELADLIRKPKRPVTLTFYRPLQAREAVQQAAAEPAADPAPPVQPPAVPPQLAIAQQASALAQQWTQIQATLTEKQALQQILAQRAGAVPPNYVLGYHRGLYPGAPGLTAYAPHSQGIVQGIVNAAAMRVSAGFQAPVQHQGVRFSIPQHAPPHAEFFTRNQRQRTTGPAPYQQVQQVQNQPSSTAEPSINSREQTQPRSADVRTSVAPTVGPRASAAVAVGTTAGGAKRGSDSSNPVSTAVHQSSSNDPGSDRNSIENTPRQIPPSQVPSSAAAAGPPATSGTNILSVQDVEAIAAMAERNPKAAEHMMRSAGSFLLSNDVSVSKSPETSTAPSSMSFLTPNDTPASKNPETSTTQSMSFLTPNDTSASKSPEPATSQSMSFLTPDVASADKSPTAVERAAESDSHSMSFLSPTDFNVETSLSRPEPEPATASTHGELNSNVSLVTVQVSRRRLYLTLGVQGTLIAVTSFVPDEFGRPGEVELSGKVFLGDVLVRVNGVYIRPGMTPSNVADIVNSSSRPLTLGFERASWDILDGRA